MGVFDVQTKSLLIGSNGCAEQLLSSVYSAWDVYHGHETTKRSHMRRTLVPAYLLMQMNVHVCKPGEILYKKHGHSYWDRRGVCYVVVSMTSAIFHRVAEFRGE